MKRLVLLSCVLVLLACAHAQNQLWKPFNAGNTCFGAASGFGTFTVPANTVVSGFALRYVSGGLTNAGQALTSYWGATNTPFMGMYVTNTSNGIIVPEYRSGIYTVASPEWYTTNITGNGVSSPNFLLPIGLAADYITVGSSALSLRLWYGEALTSSTLSDNSGTVCATVFVMSPLYVGVALGSYCFGATANTFATMTLPASTAASGFFLTRLNGSLSCDTSSGCSSFWGCSCSGWGTAENAIGIVVATGSTNSSVLVPDFSQNFYLVYSPGVLAMWYYYPGSSTSFPTLTLFMNNPVLLNSGQQLRLAYSEDFFRWSDTNNGGNMCVSVSTLSTTEFTNCTSFRPYLDTNSTGIVSGNLTVSIIASSQHSFSTVSFLNGNNSCNAASGSTWWRTTSPSFCNTAFTISQPIDTLMNACGFLRDESAVASTVFSATVLVTTVSSAGTLRGVALNTTVLTSVTVNVQFDTAVNASTGSLNVYGPSILFATVRNASYNPVSFTMTVFLVSSLQYPYQMGNFSFPTVSPDYSTSMAVGAVDPNYSLGAACNGTGIDTYGAAGLCTQVWVLTISLVNPCTGPTNFSATWTVNFGSIRCHSSFGGACNVPSPNTASVQFSTNSDNVCPRLVTNTATSTVGLSTFRDAAFSQATTDFVFGSRTFFLATVTSPIAITNVGIEQITMTAGAPAGVSILYTRTYSSSAFFISGTGTYSTSGGVLFSDAPTLMQVSDSNNATAGFVKSASFSLVWSNFTSSANNDDPRLTTIRVSLRIRYANQSLVSHQVTMSLRGDKKLMSEDPYAAATTTLGVTATVATVQAPTATTATNNGGGFLASSTALAAVGAASIVALAVTIALLLRYRKQQMQRRSTAGEKETHVTLESPQGEIEM